MSTDDTPTTATTTTTTDPSPWAGARSATAPPAVVIERTFRAPVRDVWAAVTEPERLVRRWIGTWSGDPASGAVEFRMTAEGEDVAARAVTVHECDPPRRLVLSWIRPGATERSLARRARPRRGRRRHDPDLRPARPRPRDRPRRRPGLGVLPRPARRRPVRRRRRGRGVARLRGHGRALRGALRRPRPESTSSRVARNTCRRPVVDYRQRRRGAQPVSMQGWQALHSLTRDASVKERRLTPGTTRAGPRATPGPTRCRSPGSSGSSSSSPCSSSRRR